MRLYNGGRIEHPLVVPCSHDTTSGRSEHPTKKSRFLRGPSLIRAPLDTKGKPLSNEIIETSKATQEVAKTAGKAIEASEKFGGFIAKYISGSLEQGMGIFEDKLKYMRWERQVRLIDKADEVMKSRGLDKPSRPIPLKLAIPLFEAASLEDDDYLQDLWTNLLVNVSEADSKIELQRSYIDILERLTPLEAHILEKLYSLSYEEAQHAGIITSNLPSEVTIFNEKEDKDLPEPNPEVKLALANLIRLGCLLPKKTWGGGEIFTYINPTFLGMKFVEACTIN